MDAPAKTMKKLAIFCLGGMVVEIEIVSGKSYVARRRVWYISAKDLEMNDPHQRAIRANARITSSRHPLIIF